MAHFVPYGDGYLNIDRIDAVTVLESGDVFAVVAVRQGGTNTILGREASHIEALALARELLGDAIHD